MKKTLFICTCAVVAAGILDLQAGTYYVSTNGNDSNSGTSWDTALRTPNAGFRKVHNNQSKDKLIIGPGHYILSDACACAGLTYGDEICGSTGNPNDVILDGNGQFEVVRLSGAVTLHSLTITNGTNRGRNNRASGVRVGSSTQAGNTRSVVSNCVITGCYNAYTNGQTFAGYQNPFFGGAAFVYSDGLLVNCVVRGNEAVWRAAGVTLCASGEARGCVIEQNISTNDGSAGVYGVESDSSFLAGGRLVDCVVQTNTGNFSTGVTYVRYVEGCTIRGNKILNPLHSAGGGTFGNGKDFVVTNCTFEGNSSPGGWAGGVHANYAGKFVDTRIIGNSVGGANYNNADWGGGGMLVNANGRVVTVERCVFANNVVSVTAFTGGAIEVLRGQADVVDCVISNNTAWRGGGVAVNNGGSLRMRGTLLRDNRATSGAGLVVEGSAVALLDGCKFEVNAATNAATNTSADDNIGGGGVFLYNQTTNGFCSVSNCVFGGNTSELRGGGMANKWSAYCFGEVVNCMFTNNVAARQGGGLVVREDNSHLHAYRPFLVRNSLFAFNKTTRPDGKSDANGAGVHFVSYNDVVMDSCTIVSNDSGHTLSGGVHHRWGGTITNTIIAFNTVKGEPEPVTTGSSGAWSMDASCYQNCCIYPGVPGKFLAANGCVNSDPRFENAAAGNFKLQSNSPCKHAGRVEGWMLDACDLAGQPRISGHGVDIGCYEVFVPHGMSISIK